LSDPQDTPDMEARIVRAAIECIEREGVESATIRSIAREAGVNSAAINYYFRSKDRLLRAALEQTRREGSSKALLELDELERQTGDLRSALRILLVHIFTGMLNYPRITQWHLSTPLARLGEGGEDTEYWNAFFERFFHRVRSILPHAAEEQQRFSVMQLWCCLLFPGMLPAFFRGFARLDLRDPGAAERYVDHLMEHVLAPASPPP
jgi:AcrR family transcriptional regulator